MDSSTDTTPTPEGARERAARAIYESGGQFATPWDEATDLIRRSCERKANAALDAAGLPELREEEGETRAMFDDVEKANGALQRRVAELEAERDRLVESHKAMAEVLDRRDREVHDARSACSNIAYICEKAATSPFVDGRVLQSLLPKVVRQVNKFYKTTGYPEQRIPERPWRPAASTSVEAEQ